MASYTTLTDAELADLLGRYGLGGHRATPLAAGNANSSYLVRAGDPDGGESYILTILDNHDEPSARRLAGLLDHLARHGVPVGRPVRDRDGNEVSGFGDRPVLVKRYLTGDCRSPLPRDRMTAAGRLLAGVHAVPVPDGLPARGRRLPADWPERSASFADREFAAWLRTQVALAAPVEELDDPYGLVHGDFFADNLVVAPDGGIGVLDWETATYELLVRDIGATMVGLCRIDGRFDPDRATDLLAGYEQVRPLAPAERAALLPAARYASAFVAYHRYLRHHIRRPDPAKQHLYREMPRFVASLHERWPRVAAGGGHG